MSFYDSIRIGASGAAGAHEIERSLRFNDDDNGYLTRTPSSASNRKTWTYSFWWKIGNPSGQQVFFSVNGNSNSTYFDVTYKQDETIAIGLYTNSLLKTNRVFRDITAWHHMVFAFDSTQATGTNRLKFYVNGIEQTSFSSDNRASLITQDGDFAMNSTGQLAIGRDNLNIGKYVDGYMAEINHIDGQQLTPASFGETDALTGQWNPKKYAGSYGTNGFYLNFSDTSSLGADSSGNSNNFTPNNFSTSAGEGNDSVLDTPTNNFCTLNPLDKAAAITFKNANLQVSGTSTGNYNGFRGTFGSKTGKYYWEIKFPSTGYLDAIGIARSDGRIDTGNQPTYRIVLGLGSWYNTYNSGGVATYVNATPSGDYPSVATWSGASNYSSNDIYMIAVDFGAGKIWWGKNNSWFNNSGTANPATGTDPRITFTTGNEWFPYSQSGDSSTSPQAYNFGQQGFAYTPPSGFVALNSANLLDPTILLPNKHFDTLLYSGTGSANSVTGLNFAPDWVWAKVRSHTGDHLLVDQVRGGSKSLNSNNTDAESSLANRDATFLSNGIRWNGNSLTCNESGKTYVAWNWNAGDTDGKTYTVTVVDSGGNKFRFDGFAANAVTLDLAEGGTYIFNYPSGHPFRFSTTADGTHGGGSEYTTGVTHNSSTQVTIVVAASAPQLYYYCASHSGMGGAVNTNSTLGSSNFDGSTQSKVKVNATAGFSIINYTGNGTTGSTIGHGLGVKPDLIIIKCRSNTDNWMVYHNQANGGVDPEDYYAELNSNSADVNSVIMLNDTAPTSSVFTLQNDHSVNGNTKTYVAYCFSEVAGYSKFGKYTTNGLSGDGPFIFLGFRPAFFLHKRTNDSGSNSDWRIWDSKREGANINPIEIMLQPNDADADYDSGNVAMDFLSNGIKVRASDTGNNVPAGGTFIYWAFAESPFKNSRAR